MGFIEIRGDSAKLSRIARDLRETGESALRKELLRAVRDSARSAIPEVRAEALTHLPKRGGLAERVASQNYASRTSLSGSTAKVKIIGQGMKELKLIDEGAVRHPTWGHGPWRTQTRGIRPGFFSDTLSRKGPAVRRQIDQAMRAIARKIERGA